MPELRLRADIDPTRDHIRGVPGAGAVTVVGYQDFLCPYCRRLNPIFRRLRERIGDRLVYVFRYFPLERSNPGADLAARAAEAAARQGKFFEMHDRIFQHELPVGRDELVAAARELALDLDRFTQDLDSDQVRARIAEDIAGGRSNGVTGTPTLFVDGVRYDGAWDYHSMLEGIERPLAARVGRKARAFASLPTSAGLVLVIAAVLAIVCANSPLADLYERVMNADFSIGPTGHMVSLSIRDWVAEGLLAVFFLIVGLEIRRELTTGALASLREALLPAIAALGGVVVPALIFLAINTGPTRAGWPIPTATDIAFALAVLAILGDRIPVALRVFVAALAIIDDVLSVLTIAIFFPESFTLGYGFAVLACLVVLFALNRARVYTAWPYVIAGIALWASLHAFGVHGALAGVLLALFIPTRPAPAPGPLLAQAATALAALDTVDDEARREGREAKLEGEPVWDWAARNLFATTARLLSPAERFERAVAPWSAFVVLPLFAFTASGVSFAIDLGTRNSQHVLTGTILGLAIGKPAGILLASLAATRLRIATFPLGVAVRQFVGAAWLCGIGDTMALLMADRAFDAETASVAKLGVLCGSIAAGVIGTVVLYRRPVSATLAPPR